MYLFVQKALILHGAQNPSLLAHFLSHSPKFIVFRKQLPPHLAARFEPLAKFLEFANLGDSPSFEVAANFASEKGKEFAYPLAAELDLPIFLQTQHHNFIKTFNDSIEVALTENLQRI